MFFPTCASGYRALATLLAGGVLLTGCAAPEETAQVDMTPVKTTSSTPPPPPPPPTPEEIAAERVPQDQRAKVASLMMVGVTDFDDARWKLEQGVGGIFIPSWAESTLLHEPGRDLATLRDIIGRPFAVAIDFEGGRVQRHSEVLGNYPSPREMVASGDPASVEHLAHELGLILRQHGVTVNFAPVLDVDGAGLDVVGDRSFSIDPVVAGDYGAAFARGLNTAGVAPVYKHFPGHGQASGDTHHVTAVTPPLDVLFERDIVAFRQALEQQEAAVMMGHMVVPGLGDGQTPSSLNPAAYALLREGAYPGGQPFGGLVYTDDLSGMRAISDRMDIRQAATTALAAGADQVLWSSGADLPGVIDAVLWAVDTGVIPQERIDDAAYRIQLQMVYANL